MMGAPPEGPYAVRLWQVAGEGIAIQQGPSR
jgi:hypothetical protein